MAEEKIIVINNQKYELEQSFDTSLLISNARFVEKDRKTGVIVQEMCCHNMTCIDKGGQIIVGGFWEDELPRRFRFCGAYFAILHGNRVTHESVNLHSWCQKINITVRKCEC